MGVLRTNPQIAVHSITMKAFVAVISALVAATSAGTVQYALPSWPIASPQQLTYAAQPLIHAAAAPVTTIAAAPAPITYATVNPYDYAGQVYPIAEPYLHEEIPAEAYIHEDIPAEAYVHEEI